MNSNLFTINRVCIVALLICAGCSGSESANEKTTKLDSTVPHPSQTNRAKLSADELNAELERLTKQAKSLEDDFQFEQAGEIWQTIYQRLLTQFGKNAWQVRNAKAIGQTAFQKATLPQEKLRLLRKEKPLQDRIKQQLLANDLTACLTSTRDLLALQEQVLGENAMAVGQTLLQLGSLEHRAGATEDAIQHLHRGIRVLEGVGLDEHPEIEIGHTMLGTLYADKKKFAPAVENQKSATRISGRIWGESSLQYADQANQLGVVYQQSGNLNVALKILRAAEAIRRLKLGPDDPAVAHSLLNIGIVTKDLEMYDDAEQSLLSAKKIFAQGKRPDLESYIAQCNSNLATIYMATNRPDLAEPMLHELVQSLENSDPTNPQQLTGYQYRYAIALARQGKYDVAQPLMERTLKKQQTLLGPAHPETIKTLSALRTVTEDDPSNRCCREDLRSDPASLIRIGHQRFSTVDKKKVSSTFLRCALPWGLLHWTAAWFTARQSFRVPVLLTGAFNRRTRRKR